MTVSGDAALLDEDAVAIVGARAASRAGCERATEIAATLARAGLVVMSGGAVGIDAAAHAGALARTVAVVAGGVCSPYPARNRPLFRAMLAAGGALASPFGESSPIRRWHFVRRNQVLARLCRAVVVVEAGARSGSLHTASAARAAGRLVAAVPGSPLTDGLLAAGAALVETGADVLALLEGRPRRRVIQAPDAGSRAERALGSLDPREPRLVAEICERTGMTLREAMQGLVALELSGLAVVGPGGGYVRAGEG
jgi:DNA processing protein